MQITFFDTNESWQKMLPLTYTRPVSALRIGILKIHEKMARHLDAKTSFFRSERYLAPLFRTPNQKTLHLAGNLLPTDKLLDEIFSLKENEVLIFEDNIVAGFFEAEEEIAVDLRKKRELERVELIRHPWDIFKANGREIQKDFALLTSKRSGQALMDSHTKTYGSDIFLEEGASVKACILNAENGPIYIGKHTQVQEGSLIRGPFALCDHSIIKMGAKIKGDTTIGPYSKVGGEVSNSVIQGYSNKGHDGFLGNSVLGEWCNLGANTNTSNLKNNYTNVKMWDFKIQRFRDTGVQFCGLIMGDHSKCGINTMFNTGTTVGIAANLFGGGFPRTIVPSFAWGGTSGFSTYQLQKVFETEERVMGRRNKTLTQEMKTMLTHVFETTKGYRVWDKK